MTKQLYSDDYIDGLQRAYKIVYACYERAVISDCKRAYKNILTKLDEAIDSACTDKPRIITL